MKIVVADPNLIPFRNQLEEGSPPGSVVSMHSRFDEGRLLEDLGDADVFVGTRFTPAMAAVSSRLRLVQVPGAGTDGIDRAALPDGAQCANTFHHGQSIAEYAAMALVALNRRIPEADAALRRGVWRSPSFDPTISPPSTLEGQTVGLVGFGHIGTHIWRLLRAFGMRGVAVAARALPERDRLGLDWIGQPERLPALLAESDAVVLSLPLSAETEGMIGAAELRAMKPSAVLVNVGRGRVVAEQALYEALRDRAIAGAAIDVWYSYPTAGNSAEPSRHPFGELDNVLLTPHISALTADTYRARVRDIAANISRLAAGEPLQNLVVR
jgi:phosphoglycerate dehydrogenase-like enzyme